MQAAQYNVHENVALITFNNPPVNGLSYALRAAISHYVAQANDDDNIDAIVITGSERAFSGGADVREFGTDLAFKEPILKKVIASIEDNRKPIVAAIDGVALGGGFELALGAHFRVARSGARIGLPEVNLGIFPGAGGTQRLPRVVGTAKAKEMMYTGEPISSNEAEKIGLVNKVASSGNGLNVAMELAEKISTKSLQSLSRIKKAVDEGLEKNLSEGIEIEAKLFEEAFKTEDAKEGVEAFIEKREAYFTHK